MTTDQPVTKGRRFMRLAGMTASVASRYAKTRIKSLFQSPESAEKERSLIHEINGLEIAKTLGELKGAIMKIGQMASVVGDVLPKELAEPLKALQREAPPMAFSGIAQQIERELGAPPERLFHRFDSTPFASASIGQVHRAVTDDGREVVVKVQYPGVDQAVDSDLAHLKFLLRASGLVTLKRKHLDALFLEIKTRLHEELDYCNEADNVRLFYNYHQQHPFVIVPEVIGERSSQRVLTLSYEAGDRISELDPKVYTQELRNQIGCNLFRLFTAQLFDFHTIHADPNPGNFAFRPDGTIILYDFGCIKKIPESIVQAYRRTVYCSIVEDYPGIEQGLLELGVRDPEGPVVDFDFYKKWRDLFIQPLLSAEKYDYGASNLHDEAMKLIPSSIQRMASFKPPVDLVFIDRTIVGHYGNLRKLGVQARFIDLLQPFLK